MLWLEPHTARIQALHDEGTAESLTLAALLCRLAIEQICYERLRNAHDYISHADLGRWQPRDIVRRLIQEVDPHATDTLTISISKRPAGVDPPEYVELGTQIGFDAKKLGRLWNALGSFLHVRLPKSKKDRVQAYGSVKDIKKKVSETLAELRRIEKGTLISSGVGPGVNFVCDCGQTNKRRANLLRDGQAVSCFNPDCLASWTVHAEGDGFTFELRTVNFSCHACGHVRAFFERQLLGLARLQRMFFRCPACDAENYLTWVMRHEKRQDSG